ncbi:putative ABC transporter, permease protein 1 (Cluster 1, maltose/g3p/polyamine/iron) [Actinacidiphila bryophytorum]|uniref:ABC transporter, permease protein 1 (Cluster 1, maltose/g3p/polyamine/iron) n=1 Tax=Actinacidiphila bryophytorum TaxID=1436133 RepID=A0A9W4GZG3_9ACTN|nr:putative ABC transporter, permease protein 1 (Cluster 1, maltose/g3p/polyamine/iron) [Actinacidiphila bryophytorum]
MDRRVQRLLRLPAAVHRLLLLHALQRGEPADLDRHQELVLRLQGLPAVLAGAAQHPVAGRGDGHAPGRLRPGRGPADHQDQDRRRTLPHRLLPALPGPAGRRDDGLRLPAQPRHGAGQPHPGRHRHPDAGLVHRPALVQAGPDHAGGVGHRRPDGHLHGRAARRAQGAVRGRRAGRRRVLGPVPLRDAAEHLADRDVRGGHRGHPDHAVLHAAAGGGKGRLRDHRQLRPAVRARLPRQVDPDPAPTGLRARLPALRLRLRLRHRPGALRPGDGLHRTAHAPAQRLPVGGGLTLELPQWPAEERGRPRRERGESPTTRDVD